MTLACSPIMAAGDPPILDGSGAQHSTSRTAPVPTDRACAAGESSRRFGAPDPYAAAKRTLGYLGWYAWWRVMRWLRKKHPRLTWKQLRRRFFGKDRLQAEGVALYNPAAMRVLRYRFRGRQIATPWNEAQVDPSGGRHRRSDHDDPWFLEDVQRALA